MFDLKKRLYQATKLRRVIKKEIARRLREGQAQIKTGKNCQRPWRLASVATYGKKGV